MKTSTRSLSSNVIAQSLISRYGVGPLAADPICIEWAIDEALSAHSSATVKTALRGLNAARVRAGKIPAYVPFGHPIF